MLFVQLSKKRAQTGLSELAMIEMICKYAPVQKITDLQLNVHRTWIINEYVIHKRNLMIIIQKAQQQACT